MPANTIHMPIYALCTFIQTLYLYGCVKNEHCTNVSRINGNAYAYMRERVCVCVRV